MADGFNRDEVADLLVKCHRRCCVCHRFCGSKMEIDHIIPKAEQGSNEIENAIAVCFDCHAEIHHYNNQHPKGRKFTAEEIKGHKEQWLELCKNKPEMFSQPLNADVGCIGALIDELESNNCSATNNINGMFFSSFGEEQFRRAISAGIISILAEEVKQPLLNAYNQIGKANKAIEMYTEVGFTNGETIGNHARQEVINSAPFILEAKNKLQEFLHSES